MATDTHIFKTFPEFSKLTLDDKEDYEEIIAAFPPVSDLSFASLMIWWNSLDGLAISQLNGNLVISYWLPGDEKNSGLSIAGTRKVDESICYIFDHLKAKGEPVRLIHVPEFVTRNLQFPDMFTFTEERDYDEYVAPVTRLYPLDHAVPHKKRRIRNFMNAVNSDRISVKSIDLSTEDNKFLFIEAINRWPKLGTINQIAKLEGDAIILSIAQSEELGLENVCLFIDGQLHGFCLYELPHDSNYAILKSARVSYEIPLIFDYMTYAMAQWFAAEGATMINLEMDLGMPRLRATKLALGPTNFFRKYTITPVR